MIKNLKKELPILIGSVVMIICCITGIVFLCNSVQPNVEKYLNEKYDAEFTIVEELPAAEFSTEDEEVLRAYKASPVDNPDLTFMVGQKKTADGEKVMFDTYAESSMSIITENMGKFEYTVEKGATPAEVAKDIREKMAEIKTELADKGIAVDDEPIPVTFTITKGEKVVDVDFDLNNEKAVFNKIMFKVFASVKK